MRYHGEMKNELSDDMIGAATRALGEDGAVVVRGVLDEAWVSRMRGAVERELAGPSATGVEFGAQAGRFYGDMFLWRRDDDFRAFACDSPLPALAARLLQAQRVNLLYDQLFVKEPGSIEPTPWHQDLPYWPIKGEQVISIWAPFDRAGPDNGVVSYVRGSHRSGEMFRPQAFGASKNAAAYDDSPFAPLPDIEANRDRYTFLTWALEPGDVLVHHGRTIHGAPGNLSASARRRALAVRYTGDDVRYAPRPGTFMEIEAVRTHVPAPDIAAGAPMGGVLFPQVWPRA